MSTTRRHFLAGSALALAAQAAAHAQTSTGTGTKKISPNDKIRVATIGCGIQGTGDTQMSLGQPGVELAAVADCYKGRLTHAREAWGDSVFTTMDYREVLARPDIDAVIIATPDHWHSRIAIDAMQAGKDVYCEKPMVQKIEQGHAMIEAQKKTGRILQVGSQRVSSVVYAKAKELIQQGKIGQVNMVEAWWDRNSAIGAWQYTIPPDADPTTCDWNQFQGPAPKHPFDTKRFFRWRNYQDYGTGVAGDLFVHLFSGMHFVLGALGPTRVYATGGLRFWKDGRDVPDVLLGLYDYPATDTHPAFNLALRVNFVDGAGESSGFRFVGSEGILTIGRGVTLASLPRSEAPGLAIETYSKAVQNQIVAEYKQKYPGAPIGWGGEEKPTEEKFMPPDNYNDHFDHHKNFINAVRNRTNVVEDPTFGLRAAGPALCSNLSYFQQKPLTWDPQTMTVKG